MSEPTFNPQVVSTLLNLGFTVVGAFIALSKDVTMYFIGNRTSKKAFKREKLEQLLNKVYECHEWAGQYSNEMMFGAIGTQSKSVEENPGHRLVAMALIYVQELIIEARKLNVALIDYMKMANNEYGERLKDSQHKLKEGAPERLAPRYKAVIQAIGELETKAQDIARSLQ